MINEKRVSLKTIMKAHKPTNRIKLFDSLRMFNRHTWLFVYVENGSLNSITNILLYFIDHHLLEQVHQRSDLRFQVMVKANRARELEDKATLWATSVLSKRVPRAAAPPPAQDPRPVQGRDSPRETPTIQQASFSKIASKNTTIKIWISRRTRFL